MKPIARPVYLNLLHLHLPITGWVSVLHRISGALLFLAVPLGVWGLAVSLSGEDGFRRTAHWVAHPLAKLFLVLLIWSFAHHVFAGIRHLALDVHRGVDLHHARRSSVTVMLAAGMLTLLAAWKLFA